MPFQAQLKVQRGTTNIVGDDGGDPGVPMEEGLVAGVDYVAPASQSSAFVRLTNTRHGGDGRTVNQLGIAPRDFMHFVSDASDLATEIILARPGDDDPDNETRCSWELIEYIGAPGGPDEFIVRAQGLAETSGSTNIADGAVLSNIVDPDKVVVIITGQGGYATSSGNWQFVLFTAELIDNGDGTYTPRFTRGQTSSLFVFVSYVVIELTGSNWLPVQRISHDGPVDDLWTEGDFTISDDVTIPTALTDPAKSFLADVQYRTDFSGSAWVSECGDVLYLVPTLGGGQASHLRYAAGGFNMTDGETNSTHTTVCWLVESISDDILVHHQLVGLLSETGLSEPEQQTQELGVTLRDTAQAMLCGVTGSSRGSTTDTPRGSVDLELANATQALTRRNDHGEPQLVTFDIVEFPRIFVTPPPPTPPCVTDAVSRLAVNEAEAQNPDYEAASRLPIHEAICRPCCGA